MPKNKKIIATLLVVLIFIIEGAFAAEDTFKGSITGSSGGLGNIGEGIFPFSVSWSKNKDITILDEDEYDKAHLVFSFSSSDSSELSESTSTKLSSSESSICFSNCFILSSIAIIIN